MSDNPIRTPVDVPIEHVLVLLPADQQVPGMIDVTPSRLKTMGYTHRMAFYERYKHLFERAGRDIDASEPQPGVDTIRYILCEYLTQYDHDPDPSDFERLKVALHGADLALTLLDSDGDIDLDDLVVTTRQAIAVSHDGR